MLGTGITFVEALLPVTELIELVPVEPLLAGPLPAAVRLPEVVPFEEDLSWSKIKKLNKGVDRL